MEEKISIPVSEYEDLIKTSRWMNALEAAGVDNWDGIDFAREIYNGENDV